MEKNKSGKIKGDRFCSKKGDFVFKTRTKEPKKVGAVKSKA